MLDSELQVIRPYYFTVVSNPTDDRPTCTPDSKQVTAEEYVTTPE